MKSYPERKRIRLKDFDYASYNYYFVTVCTADKKYLFGMGNHLSKYGIIAQEKLLEIQNHYDCVTVDKYVIMPNHLHAIIAVESSDNDKNRPTLGTIVGAYKASVSREIHKTNPKLNIWQSRFYDHVILCTADYENVWTYIDDNPRRWQEDEYC